MQAAPGSTGQTDALRLVVDARCPQCAGTNTWGILQRSMQCAFCSSLLYWPTSEDTHVYLAAEDRLAGDGHSAAALAGLEAFRQRSAMIGDLVARAGEDPTGIARDRAEQQVPSLAEMLARILPQVTILEERTLYVPYKLVHAELAFHALGRMPGGLRKIFRTLFLLLEDIVPSYSPPWNFRDHGLWFSKSRLRPLDSDTLSAALFLDPHHGEPEREEILKRWLKRSDMLKDDMDPICCEAGAASWKEWLIFRPYHFVRAQTPWRPGWFMLDGQFGTLAGHPEEDEVDYLKGGGWKRLDEAAVRPPAFKAFPFRCSNCMSELRVPEESGFLFCHECGLLLELGETGLQPLSYRVFMPEDTPWAGRGSDSTAWLPFWSVRGTWRFEGREYADPLDIAGVFTPPVKRACEGGRGGGRALYFPAFECMIYDGYDDFAFEIAAAMAAANREPSDMRLCTHIALGPGDTVIPPAVSRSTAENLFPASLPSFFPLAAQLKLTTLLLKRLSGITLQMAPPELVYVGVGTVTGKEGERRVQGPAKGVGLAAIEEHSWPPVLCRTVRRKKEARQTEG